MRDTYVAVTRNSTIIYYCNKYAYEMLNNAFVAVYFANLRHEKRSNRAKEKREKAPESIWNYYYYFSFIFSANWIR